MGTLGVLPVLVMLFDENVVNAAGTSRTTFKPARDLKIGRAVAPIHGGVPSSARKAFQPISAVSRET